MKSNVQKRYCLLQIVPGVFLIPGHVGFTLFFKPLGFTFFVGFVMALQVAVSHIIGYQA